MIFADLLRIKFDMEFNVVINIDDNYVQHCMAMLCSLFENNKKHYIHVHVLTAKLSKENTTVLNNLAEKYDNKIHVYKVDESPLEGVQFRKERPLSKAAYYRLLLASILPVNINKILYLDCDMIVLGDVSELFDLEIDNYALAATLDTFPYSSLHRRQLHLSMNADVLEIRLSSLMYSSIHSFKNLAFPGSSDSFSICIMW